MPVSFVVALIVFVIGLIGCVVTMIAYASLPAPSVQGGDLCPGCWLIGGGIVAALVAGSHFVHLTW